jgi:hypothetical protein
VAALSEPHRPGFALSAEDREALIRVLYVVKDNWWLDEQEEDVLQRLLELVPPSTAARSISA